MSCMSGSPNLNRFRDRGQVAVQLVSCGVLLPGHIYIYIYIYIERERTFLLNLLNDISAKNKTKRNNLDYFNILQYFKTILKFSLYTHIYICVCVCVYARACVCIHKYKYIRF